MKTKNYKGYDININYQEDSESPREWDNLGTIAYKHSRYTLGEELIGDPVDWLCKKLGLDLGRYCGSHEFNSPYSDEVLRALEVKLAERYIALKLYLYEHSGLFMSTKPFYCPWDSGQVGYIYVSHADVFSNYGGRRMTAKLKARAVKCLEGEISTFNTYLQGSVFFYDACDPSGNSIGSAGGFYGSDHEDSGLLDEARAEIDYHIKQSIIKHTVSF